MKKILVIITLGLSLFEIYAVSPPQIIDQQIKFDDYSGFIGLKGRKLEFKGEKNHKWILRTRTRRDGKVVEENIPIDLKFNQNDRIELITLVKEVERNNAKNDLLKDILVNINGWKSQFRFSLVQMKTNSMEGLPDSEQLEKIIFFPNEVLLYFNLVNYKELPNAPDKIDLKKLLNESQDFITVSILFE